MLDKLFSLFKMNKIRSMNNVLRGVEDIICTLDNEFHDTNLKNDALDSLIKLLESHKTLPPAVISKQT